MERNKRRVLTGEVVSSSSDKTISVVVTSYQKHPLYGKRVIQTKKYAVHDEANEANVGDTVRIMETRPLSKTKRFRLVEIVSTKA
jgi:small subunit ribosomal protein S17